MPPSLDDALNDLEAALPDGGYDPLITAFRTIEIPGDVDSETLKRIYRLCYRVLGIAPHPMAFDSLEPWQAGHLNACAASLIEESLYDRNAQTRAWIAEREARYEARGKTLPKTLADDRLPPEIAVPWDVETAKEQIAPFLKAYEGNLAHEPCAHFKLCYDVMSDGYPVFRQVFSDWMDDLDKRKLGQPGMKEGLAKADEFADLSEDVELIPWSQCKSEIVPLLDHAHPMVAAGAARYLGALYTDPSFETECGAPALPKFLHRLAERDENRTTICGAFVNGFDTGGYGLGSLAHESRLKEADFDLDEWVISGLSADEEEVYIPNALALWFYVHEFYDFDPGFVTRLIDSGKAWIAMMCATEQRQRVEGMEPVLHRLAKNEDPEVAEAAQAHLAQYYLH